MDRSVRLFALVERSALRSHRTAASQWPQKEPIRHVRHPSDTVAPTSRQGLQSPPPQSSTTLIDDHHAAPLVALDNGIAIPLRGAQGGLSLVPTP